MTTAGQYDSPGVMFLLANLIYAHAITLYGFSYIDSIV